MKKYNPLVSIVIPSTIITLGIRVIDSCSKLNVLYYEGNKQKWSTIQKEQYWDKDAGIKGKYEIVYDYISNGV